MIKNKSKSPFNNVVKLFNNVVKLFTNSIKKSQVLTTISYLDMLTFNKCALLCFDFVYTAHTRVFTAGHLSSNSSVRRSRIDTRFFLTDSQIV